MLNPFFPAMLQSWCTMAAASVDIASAVLATGSRMARALPDAAPVQTGRMRASRSSTSYRERQAKAINPFDPFGLANLAMDMLVPGQQKPASSYPMAAAFPFAMGHAADTGAWPTAQQLSLPFPGLSSYLTPAAPFGITAFPKVFLGYWPAPVTAFGTPYEGWGLLTLGLAVPPGLVRFAGNPSPVWLAA